MKFSQFRNYVLTDKPELLKDTNFDIVALICYTLGFNKNLYPTAHFKKVADKKLFKYINIDKKDNYTYTLHFYKNTLVACIKTEMVFGVRNHLVDVIGDVGLGDIVNEILKDISNLKDFKINIDINDDIDFMLKEV